MAFRIGSINMYKFSYQKDKEISKNISKIANVINSEEFDIVALQEVLNENVLRNLCAELGAKWSYVWDSPISRSVQAAEGYAFLWNQSRFRLATSMTKEEQQTGEVPPEGRRIFQARIHDNYRSDDALYKGKLIRDPLYARFESIYGWYEVRLINTHIIHHDSERTDTEGDKDKRRRELQILASILDKLEDKQYRNNRPSYTFLLGDYNLSLSDICNRLDLGVIGGTEAITKIIVDRDGTKKVILSVQHELSTLKARSKNDPDTPAHGFANNFDHFTYNQGMRSRADLHSRRVNSVEKYWGNDFELHRKEFSDHVPIGLDVEFK